MSTNAVFNSKFNVVAVDPDKNEVIQIPGTEFQAPASSDLFEKISVIPNWDGPAGSSYSIAVGIDQVHYDREQPCEAYRFRISDLHVGWFEEDKNNRERTVEVLSPAHLKMIKASGWAEKREHFYNPQAQGCPTTVDSFQVIKIDRDLMKNEGLEWNGEKTFLGFNVEFCKGKMVVHTLKSDSITLEDEPIGHLYTLPVRLYIPQLDNK